MGDPDRGRRRERRADGTGVPARRRGAGHHAARLRRHGGPAPRAGRAPARLRAVPDRAGCGRGPGGRHHRGRGRLRDQAVQPGRGAGPAARAAAPGRDRPLPQRHRAGGRRPDHGRGRPRGTPGRRADRADRHRVRAAAFPYAQPTPGPVQGTDPRPGLELRLRRAGPRGGALRQLPAQEDRRRPGALDPHRPRRRLRAQADGLMSQRAGGPARPARTRMSRLGDWFAGRTLRWRLITGLLALLAVACAVVGLVIYVTLQRALLGQVDAQLMSAGGRYAACMEANDAIEHADDGGNAAPPENQPGPAPREQDCSRITGQAAGTFGARIKNGVVTAQGIVSGKSRLSAADRAALAHLPPDGHFYTLDLDSLHGDYRLTAIPGHDHDVLITGLPLAGVEETLRKVEMATLTVFGGALLFTGIIGSVFVGLSLRPLRRVAATATRVTELPLASGEVSLPERVPDADPRTEVGQVGAA